MTNDTSNAIMEKSRVLFTGNREFMINDLMRHFPEQYITSKCQPVDHDFIHALDEFEPHVIIVCLMDETRDMLRMYHILEEKKQYFHISIIALGHEEDCSTFRRRVQVRTMETFVRPFDRTQFLERVSQFAELSHKTELSLKAEQRASIPPAPPVEPAQPEICTQPIDSALALKIEQAAALQGRKSILVVDDDVRMLNIIKLYLQDLYDITVVPSGKLALKFLAKKSIDLVLLDYMMPELDGPAVLQQIRQASPIPNIPVVFLTGVDDRDMVIRGLEFHPNGYLLKPITREVLLEKVTEVLLGL